MKRTFTLALALIFISAFSTVAFLPSEGAAANTITVPDDYPTLSAAIANAAEGDTILVKAGTYKEQTLTVNKTIQIRGENAENTIIVLHPPLIFNGYNSLTPAYIYKSIIVVNADNVELSELTITCVLTNEEPADLSQHALGPTTPKFDAFGGAEISVKANNTTIKNCIIPTALAFDGSFGTISSNTLTGGVSCTGSNNQIASNTVTGYGVRVGGVSNNVYCNSLVGDYHVRNQGGIQTNGDGNIIAYNNITNFYSGLGVSSLYGVGSNNVFYANRIINDIYGIGVSGGVNNTFYANELVNNTAGVSVGSSEPPEPRATFYHNNFIGSVEQVDRSHSASYVPGAWREPFNASGIFDNGLEGNYWSDYTGVDSNGDGVGDSPYIIDGNRQDHHPLMAPFDISTATLATSTPTVEPSKQEPLSTALVIVGIVVVAVVGFGLLVLFKARKQIKPQPTKF